MKEGISTCANYTDNFLLEIRLCLLTFPILYRIIESVNHQILKSSVPPHTTKSLITPCPQVPYEHNF